MRKVLFLLLLAGCTDQVAGDDRSSSFGGNGGKEDGQYSACQLAEVLKYVNESTSTTDTLQAAQLSGDAANAIVAYRNGADGTAGTGDDEVFDDLDELDKVDFIGPIALGHLAYAIAPRCEVDLASRPFIDDTTYAGQGTGGWARDDQEVESVLGVTGLSGKRLRQLMLAKDDRGRTLYDRVRKSSAMEAFTTEFALDEVPWTTSAQAAREQIPYVALTIEPDRFAPPTEGGVREISLGTDLNDDVYYDTDNYTLLANDIELRGRARWDSPTEVRRILIAAKFGTEIDAEGNKVNTKVDIRNDSADAATIARMDDDVRRGKVAWNGGDAPVTPEKGVFEQLAAAKQLLTIGSHTDVLLLEPKAHIRSTRSRYHMNEASTGALHRVYANGATRIQFALAAADQAKTAGGLSAADAAAIDDVETMGHAILDGSLLVDRIGAAGATVTKGDLDAMFGTSSGVPASGADLAKRKIAADTLSTVYHEFAAALDDADRAIADARDEDGDVLVDEFRAWQASQSADLAKKTTYDPYVAAWQTLDANPAAAMFVLNTYGAAQKIAKNDAFKKFVGYDADRWARLGKHLRKAALTVAEHQIETAGIAARQLWFDSARELWVPASSRAFSNFMIDTTDLSEMLSHEEWTSIPEADRTFAAPLPATKVFHSTFVNELQIELGMEKAYLDRLRELDAAVAAAPTDAALAEQLAGARFVWAQYTGAMKVLTTLKGDNVIKKLKNAGANQDIKWGAPPDSKGNIALKILADRD